MKRSFIYSTEIHDLAEDQEKRVLKIGNFIVLEGPRFETSDGWSLRIVCFNFIAVKGFLEKSNTSLFVENFIPSCQHASTNTPCAR